MPALYVDESEQGDLLAVGGFYADLRDLPRIEAAWRDMKSTQLGLDGDDELKWSLPEGHPTRKKLDAAGMAGRMRNEAMIGVLRELPITLVCAVMRENRGSGWLSVIGRRSVRDFYCEGLRYVLQRFGDEAQGRGDEEPWLCVVDKPEGLHRMVAQFHGTTIRPPWRSASLLEHESKAAHALYRTAMCGGPGNGPRGQVPPLRQIAFISGLLMGHGSHDDLLQVADCVVGVTGSCVKSISSGNASDWRVDQLRALVPKFRGGRSGMFRDGFMLWPQERDLWSALKNRLL